MEHRHFYDIVDYLEKGDVLVLNNSKVFPARLIGKRKETGGKVEVFLLRQYDHPLVPSLRRGDIWQCLVGGPRRKAGLTVEFEAGLKGEIFTDNQDGTWNVRFNKTGKAMMRIVERIGITPLPPYIKRNTPRPAAGGPPLSRGDSKNYQTVYANERKIGSVAAPTAGLHFTPALLRKIKKKGVEIEYVTLHVGLGTFAPVKENYIKKHKMHAEYVEVEEDVIKRIILAKTERRKIIAVGTTSVRTLESLFQKKDYYRFLPLDVARGRNDKNIFIRNSKFEIRNFVGWVDIFIYPGYKFKIVDAMITNFHLPKSTLLMLVSALAGKDKIDMAYKLAIKQKYRFYSYGDAMFIC